MSACDAGAGSLRLDGVQVSDDLSVHDSDVDVLAPVVQRKHYRQLMWFNAAIREFVPCRMRMCTLSVPDPGRRHHVRPTCLCSQLYIY